MFDFHEKRRIKSILYSKGTLFILLIVIVLLLNGVWNIFGKAWETKVVRKKLERELIELQIHEAELRSEIERLSSPRGIEEEIRGSFDVAKENEDVLVIIDPKEGEDVAENPKTQGFWSRTLNFFFSN